MKKFIIILLFIGMMGCVDIDDHTSNKCERLNKEFNELRFKYMSCDSSNCHRALDDLNFFLDINKESLQACNPDFTY